MGIASLAASDRKVNTVAKLSPWSRICVLSSKTQADLVRGFYYTAFHPDNGQSIPTQLCLWWKTPFFPFLLFASTKSSPLASPQKAQAMTNCTLQLLNCWPPSSWSPWQALLTSRSRQLSYGLTGRRQWSLINSRTRTQKTLPTTVQWAWPQLCVRSSTEYNRRCLKKHRAFIGYSGWPITLQLQLDTLAPLCKLNAYWLSGPAVVCEFLTIYAVDVMYNTVLAEPL